MSDINDPVLIIYGDQDVCQHVDRGREFAERAGADVIIIEGAGHLTLGRDPVRVHLAIKRFVDRTTGATRIAVGLGSSVELERTRFPA